MVEIAIRLGRERSSKWRLLTYFDSAGKIIGGLAVLVALIGGVVALISHWSLRPAFGRGVGADGGGSVTILGVVTTVVMVSEGKRLRGHHGGAAADGRCDWCSSSAVLRNCDAFPTVRQVVERLDSAL